MSQQDAQDDSFLDIEQVENPEVTTEKVETVDAAEVEAAQPEADPEIKPAETAQAEVETTATKEAEKPDKESWTFSQAMDEREKRQAAVKERDALQEKLDALEKPDDVSVFESNITEIQLSKQSVAFEFRLENALGNWISMAAHGMNLLFDKNINGIIINFWDITKRKEYEKELEKTNETKNKLFSIIGHDLRGLVGTSKSVIDYILEEKENISKDEMFELLTPTQKSNESLVLLLDNLLTWSKSQLETISYIPKNYQLLPLINENIKIFQRVAEDKSISITISGDTNIKAYFDKEQVNFVFRNLLQNAIKYSYKNSNISIELKNKNGYIQCGVHDSGTGMDKKRQLSLFQNSFPVSVPGTNSEKGSGLGLMLCKEFVENNNGEIWVETESNKGSSFYFSLPVNPTPDAV